MLVFILAFAPKVLGSSIPHIGDDYKHLNEYIIHNESLVVFFVFLSLAMGSIMKEINRATAIPYSPMLFFAGILAGYYWESLGVIGKSCKLVSDINPNGVLIIFLPVLIYEAGFKFDWHIFKKLFIQIIILAFPSVIILSFFLQFSLKVLLQYDDSYYTWNSAFMFGSILSCTDTVAVLALLKECGAPRRFQSLIEGESLLNDGACMVLFAISYAIVKGAQANIYQIISLFIQLTLGGTVLGLLFGIISVYWIQKIFNDQILVLNITLVSSYLIFFVAEHQSTSIEISPILALVSLSLFMSAFGRTRISHEAENAVKEFWDFMVYASETIIFLLAGIIVAIQVLTDDSILTKENMYKLIGLYGCAMIGRFLAIAVFMPFLKKFGYGLRWKEAIVLTWGGLRGAVGITFALIVAKDQELPEKLKEIILFHISGVAILTLLLNGTTLSLLVKAIGLSTQSLVREKIYSNFLKKLVDEIETQCEKNGQNKFLQDADWNEVRKLSGQKYCQAQYEQIQLKIDKKEKQIKEIKMKNLKKLKSQEEQLVDDDEDDREVNIDLLIEVRRILIMALKGIYYGLFERNQCSPDGLILLTQSANLDLDNDKEHMNSWDFLEQQFSERYINGLFYLKDIWIIGKMAKHFLFGYIFYIYDVVSSYIEALEILREETINYNFDERLINDMISEIEDNRNSAIHYLQDYLEVSFPEISKELHTKKAAFSILEQQKRILQHNLMTGQLEEKDYISMKRLIDKKVVMLNNMSISWQLPSLYEIVSTNQLFQHIPEQILRKLITECREESFGRDQIIFKEGDRVNEALIITRGGGSEFTDKLNNKLKEKRMLGDVAPIYMLVAPSIRYHTTFIADCVMNATFFKVSTLQKIMKQVPLFEEQVYKYALELLSKIYSEQLSPLCYFNKLQIQSVINHCTFQRYKKNSIFKIDQGCILLKGTLVENSNLHEVQEEQSSENDGDINTKSNNLNIWKRDAICLIPPATNALKCTTSCLMLLFKNFQILQIVTQVDNLQIKSSRRSRAENIRSQKKL